MPRIEVPFIVDKQIITQSPTVKLVGGGQNYFYATFKICDIWKKVSGIKVVFTRENIVKVISLSKGDDCWECEIPWEVMAEKGVFYVGVFGDDMLLTDTAYVEVLEGCLTDGDEPLEPSPDWFATMEKNLSEKVDKEELDKAAKQIADNTEKKLNEANENLQKYIESSKIFATASSNTPIYDVNRNADNNGIEAVNFYGTVSQDQGATLKTPKPLKYPTSITRCTIGNYYDWNYKQTLTLPDNVQLKYPFLAVNDYKDSGWYDFKTKKIHYKTIIKKVVLNGTETGSLPIWYKASYPEGRYFANLHRIPGVFTDEDLSRIQNDIRIAYNDAKCSIGSEYYDTDAYGDFQESGQFRLTQGMSNGVGFFRFEFFAPEFDTLNEVLATLKKNPITLLIPMIYDIQVYGFDYDLTKEIKSYNKFNPLSLYFGGYDASERLVQIPTEVTYQLDVGLSIQNMKNAITALGGKI